VKSIQTTAIVIKSTDYKENDKLVRLFTVDGGIVGAAMRGVKKAGAKLKFAAQPFAFCEYTLTESRGFYTVTGAQPSESLYALAGDPDRYAAAALMCEAADSAVSALPSPALFVFMLKIFKEMIYQNADPYAAAALFLGGVLENAGYGKPDRFLPDITPQTLPKTGSGDFLRLLKSRAAVFEHRYGVKLVSLSVL
jgi:DNA repair protein RecO (recombination protein O)